MTLFGISKQAVERTFPVTRDDRTANSGSHMTLEVWCGDNGIWNVNDRPVHSDGAAGVAFVIAAACLHLERENKKANK